MKTVKTNIVVVDEKGYLRDANIFERMNVYADDVIRNVKIFWEENGASIIGGTVAIGGLIILGVIGAATKDL